MTGAGPPLQAWAGLPLETRAWAGPPLKAGAWAGMPLEARTGAAPLLEGTPGYGPPLETETRVARRWSPRLGPAHRRKQNWGRFAAGGLDWSATVAREWGWSIVLSACSSVVKFILNYGVRCRKKVASQGCKK